MPVSRPSRVGDPTPRDRDDAKDERKRAQLQKAREARDAKRLRDKEEAIRKKWQSLRRDLCLSRRQESLVRAVNRPSPFNEPSFELVIRAVYGVEWDRLSDKQRFEYRGRLRVVQHALNLKLGAKGYSHRIASRKGKVFLVRFKEWKEGLEPRRIRHRTPAQSKGNSGRQSAVTRCAEWLWSYLTVKKKSVFKDGWIPVAMLKEDVLRAGFCLSSFKNARKRLGLQKRHVGYGDKGGWEVHLPTPKEAKT